jgi:pyruvate dehydrogenase E2 component (dihydrolipoamide acetyltransferase)/2-oxoisovalerate dehydrogenase E2 component (dihydrolipoyl transacylase)
MDFRVPELGEGVYEAEFVSWQVKVGDKVRRGQNLMEVLTDKATMEVPSPFAGTVTALHAEPGEQIKVGQVVLSYTPAGQPEGAREPAPAQAEVQLRGTVAQAQPTPARAPAAPPRGRSPAPADGNGSSRPAADGLPVKAAPSVRYMARKLGIDLARVRGSGPEGRVLIGDLTAHVQAAGPKGERPAGPRADHGTPGTRVKLRGLRRKIAEHMVLSKKTIPHYSYVEECDVTDLVKLREALRERFANEGVKLTYLAFFVKAAALALKEVPVVNASLDEQAGEIVLHDRYHVGVAVATPAGLIVPVVRDADRKGLAEVARDIDRLSAEARAGKSRLDDLRGGTFTVTSVGGIGGLISTPIIHHPEVGILGLGKVVRRPVYDAAGNLRPADLLYLSFSFDHRVVDGAVGAAFGNAVLRPLQNPALLLLPEKLV